MKARYTAISFGISLWLWASVANAQPAMDTSLKPVDELVSQGQAREAGIEARQIGESLQRKGRYPEAIEALERSSELLGSQDPGWFASRRALAETYDLAGMPDRAKSEWNALFAHFSSQSDLDREIRREILVHLASHYAKHGDRERAIATYSEVVESAEDPRDCDFFVQEACRELIREFGSEGNYARAADVSRRLVGCWEVRVAQVPSWTEDLVKALQEYSRLSHLAGRPDQAKAARERAADLLAH